jgi:hypothetical protein
MVGENSQPVGFAWRYFRTAEDGKDPECFAAIDERLTGKADDALASGPFGAGHPMTLREIVADQYRFSPRADLSDLLDVERDSPEVSI